MDVDDLMMTSMMCGNQTFHSPHHPHWRRAEESREVKELEGSVQKGMIKIDREKNSQTFLFSKA